MYYQVSLDFLTKISIYQALSKINEPGKEHLFFFNEKSLITSFNNLSVVRTYPATYATFKEAYE